MRQWFDTVYPLYLYGQTGDAMASYSFDQAASEPLVPDNWLISPAIELPYDRFCEASWYSMLFNNQYPDTYAVYVVENKSINSMIYEAPVLIDSVSAGDTLVHHTIRLDEYVGKRVHIAFRHFRSPGMFGLLIDQFSVYATADNPNPQSIERAEMSIVSIYPNPSRDKVRIEATAAIRELKLYDMNGKEVMRCEGCDELEIGAVAEGVYFLEVTTAERQSIHKVIKQ